MKYRKKGVNATQVSAPTLPLPTHDPCRRQLMISPADFKHMISYLFFHLT